MEYDDPGTCIVCQKPATHVVSPLRLYMDVHIRVLIGIQENTLERGVFALMGAIDHARQSGRADTWEWPLETFRRASGAPTLEDARRIMYGLQNVKVRFADDTKANLFTLAIPSGALAAPGRGDPVFRAAIGSHVQDAFEYSPFGRLLFPLCMRDDCKGMGSALFAALYEVIGLPFD